MNAPQFDPNAELRAAQAAVQERRHPAAVAHLARLLPQFPTHPLVTSLLDELVATAPDPLKLIPSGAADYGTAAVHVYALGKCGLAADAFGILRQLDFATPANGIIDWALPWLDAGQLSDEQRGVAAM